MISSKVNIIFAWLGCVSNNRHRDCRTCNFDYLVNRNRHRNCRMCNSDYLVDRNRKTKIIKPTKN